MDLMPKKQYVNYYKINVDYYIYGTENILCYNNIKKLMCLIFEER